MLWKSSFYPCSQHFSPIQHSKFISFIKKIEATVALDSVCVFFFKQKNNENLKNK